MTKKQKNKSLTNININNKKDNEAGAENKYDIMAVIFFVLAIFFLLSIFDLAGKAGAFFYEKLDYLLGAGYIILPIMLITLGVYFLKSKSRLLGHYKIISSITLLLSILGIITTISRLTNSSSSSGGSVNSSSSSQKGGLLGELVSDIFVKFFDHYISIAFLGAILIISILVMFNIKLRDLKININALKRFKKSIAPNKKEEIKDKMGEKIKVEDLLSIDSNDEEYKKNIEVEDVKTNGENNKGDKKVKDKNEITKIINENDKNDYEGEIIKQRKSKLNYSMSYSPPPLSLIEQDHGKPNTGDIKVNANMIKRTLENFGINVEMEEITIGPTVTRYALKPAEGIKLSRILALQNDLALALAAHPIRIEAPIPGKSLVGVEVPNQGKTTVGLASMVNDDGFKNAKYPVMIALGRSIDGKAIFENLAKMPHCLIAGTTGAGKSVTIHSIIVSLLYRNSPNDLKFIMVDPKRVELTLYKNLPHLLTPVITEAKKTILALRWAAKEMDRRYDILEKEAARDIESYNKIVKKEELEHLPYIVIIIDELADIMSVYPRELEAAIVRLAQMSRAVGIHLILSTQRPEVNIITGLIKANIPARIALKVASQVDSRTILDTAGAEKLLGAGDMLYSSGSAAIERLQSVFISENEVKNVVKYLVDAYQDELPKEISLTPDNILGVVLHENVLTKSQRDDIDDNNDKDNDDEIIDDLNYSDENFGEGDPMYEKACSCVIESGKASTSYLQRRLRLGYARAARLMDMLEKNGVVSPGEGAKKRDVLIKPDQNFNDNQDSEKNKNDYKN